SAPDSTSTSQTSPDPPSLPNESSADVQSFRQKLGLITDIYATDQNNYMFPSSPDTPSQENDTFPSDSLSGSTFFYKRLGRGHSHSLSIDSTMSIDQHPVVYSFSHALLSTTYETNEDSTPELTPNFVTPIDTFTQRSSSPKTPFFTEHSLSSTFVNMSPVSSSGKSASLVENPPRKLLLQSPMQQIMNSSSVQDRYLFLFNDLLIIAKPINTNSQKNNVSTTEKLYQVKHIIAIHQIIQIALTMQEDRDAALINKTPKREPSVMATFSRKFSTDPHGAIADMLERRHIKNDPVHIAAFLFKKSELSKRQLGLYLSNQKNEEIMIAFLDKFRFEGLYIDEALRVFLMSICLPPEQESFNYLIKSFANRWYNANVNVVKFNEEMSIKLTFAMLYLNCGLHERHNAMDNQNVKNAKRTDFITLQDFVNRFRRESDQFCLVPDELLEKVYYSIYEDKLVFAWDDTLEDISPQIPIKLHPARWPTRLTLLTPSDPITITIPHPDPHFAIRLHGQDLIFDPPLLDFTHTNSCTFTITGKTLGLHSMVLIKSGARCRNYINLPSTKIVLVERAFMKWTFQISFITDNGMIRKYHFSVDSQERRRIWVESIRTNVLEEKLRSNSLSSP
ncbi:2709_t:CDS:1, partial [Racocetra persica]